MYLLLLEPYYNQTVTWIDPECPSSGSIMRSNIYRGSRLFKYYVRPNLKNATSASKTRSPGDARNRRLRTSLNVTTKETLLFSVHNNNKNFYAICPDQSHCISSVGKCYAERKGTSDLVCINSTWIDREDNKTPIKTSKGFFIHSLLNSKINSGHCPRSTDGVSTSGRCYVNGGELVIIFV